MKNLIFRASEHQVEYAGYILDEADNEPVGAVFHNRLRGQADSDELALGTLLAHAPNLKTALRDLSVNAGEALALTTAGLNIPAPVWVRVAKALDAASALLDALPEVE